jgi:hypothetical protein
VRYYVCGQAEHERFEKALIGRIMIYDNEVEILLVEDNMSDAELTSGP